MKQYLTALLVTGGLLLTGVNAASAEQRTDYWSDPACPAEVVRCVNPPINLAVSTGNNNAVLEWQNADGSETDFGGYEVWVTNDSTGQTFAACDHLKRFISWGPNDIVDTSAAESDCTINNLAPATLYQFSVAAYGKGRVVGIKSHIRASTNWVASTTTTSQPHQPTPTAAVTNLQVEALSATSILLDWTNLDGTETLEGYWVSLNHVASGWSGNVCLELEPVAGAVKDSECVISGLVAGEAYRVFVATVGTPGVPVDFRMDYTPPATVAPPTTVQPTPTTQPPVVAPPTTVTEDPCETTLLKKRNRQIRKADVRFDKKVDNVRAKFDGKPKKIDRAIRKAAGQRDRKIGKAEYAYEAKCS